MINSVVKGTTSYSAYVVLYDSSVTTGAGKTGLVYNASGLKAYYVRSRAAAAAITLATQTPTGAYSSGGFVEVDATNAPGLYRLDLPDAALATGVNEVMVVLTGAANMAQQTFKIALTGVDPQDATAFGVSRIDATVSSRASQTSVDTVAGYIDTEVAAIKAKTDNLPVDPADASDIASSFSTVNSTLSTIAGYIDTEVAAIKAKTDNLPATPAATGDAMALTSSERNSIADAYLDRANAIETGLTPRQAQRLIAAALAGLASGAATATITFRNAVADSKNRIVATVDADGNRSAITYDVS